MLATSTQRVYASKLRRWRRLLVQMPQDHPDLPAVLVEIDKLSNKLGAEVSDLEALLARRPGRHVGDKPTAPNPANVEASLLQQQREPSFWSAEAVAARARAVKSPDEQRSEVALRELVSLGGDADENDKDGTRASWKTCVCVEWDG
jgi:hypothetical protein